MLLKKQYFPGLFLFLSLMSEAAADLFAHENQAGAWPVAVTANSDLRIKDLK